MEWLAQIFRANPVIPVFLAIGLGFWLGKLRYKSFSLGPVAATLIVGVLIGQLQIAIPNEVKSIFFNLFLFSIAYSVGPQFFRAFQGPGIKQVIFALLEAAICAGTVILGAKLMGYDMGVAAGMFAGSQTASASLGVTTETVRSLDLAESAREHLLAVIPACYAVTYVFGTIGSAWFLSNIGPMLLGGLEKVREETAEIEQEMDSGEFQPEPGYIAAERPVSFRAYKAEGEFFSYPRSLTEIEAEFERRGQRVFVERVRIKGEVREAKPKLKLKQGDAMVLSGRREDMVEPWPWLGPEIADHELLSFGAEKLQVVVSKSGSAGVTFGALRRADYMKGVVINGVTRNNLSLPLRARTVLQRGDVITLVGLPSDVARASDAIGYADRQTDITDMIFLGLGIAAGCFVGAISFRVEGVPVSISTSGGTLLAGLCLGWLRGRHPTFGWIPTPVVWIFTNLGLNMFIAVVGISSGATFLASLKQEGLGLFFMGCACTLVALTINIFIARKIFHFSSPETLGCVAGARCGIASIGAIQDALESNVPAIGYTVTYAVANLVLPFSSLLVLVFV